MGFLDTLLFQCPLRRARVLRGVCATIQSLCAKPVSMPFKTGKGTAGGGVRQAGAARARVSMPFKTGKGTAGPLRDQRSAGM